MAGAFPRTAERTRKDVALFFPFFNIIITFIHRFPGKRLLVERVTSVGIEEKEKEEEKEKKTKKKKKKGKRTRKLDFPHSEPCNLFIL